MENVKIVGVGNDYYPKYFEELCLLLEQGEAVRPCVNCIGHTRNNMTQEAYKKQLIKKYGEKLIIEKYHGYCSYGYNYKLKINEEK